MTRAVITGACGFIGAYLVKKLLKENIDVIAIDNLTRGQAERLKPVIKHITLHQTDARDENTLIPILNGADVVFHLAAVNGTDNFYKRPELVLDVGLRSALAVTQACIKANIPDLIIASSAEVYQTPEIIPTNEAVALKIPDSLNPRYSYAASKIISEVIAFNFGRNHFRKVQVFRPHNVYGPDMGYKHVIPQFIQKFKKLAEQNNKEKNIVSMQGDGSETRAFCYIDDIVEGIHIMYQKGGHREIYHIGHDHEITIKNLARKIGHMMQIDAAIIPGDPAEGGTPQRCPSIEKMRALGYIPKVSLDSGLKKTITWYQSDDTDENGIL